MGTIGFLRRSVAVIVVCLTTSVLTGMGETSIRINLSAHVPLACTVGFDAASGSYNDAGRIHLGSTRENCNSPNGYRLFASTSGTDNGASLVVGNRTFGIQNSAEVLVAESIGPNENARNIYLDAGEGHGGGNISIRIEAK